MLHERSKSWRLDTTAGGSKFCTLFLTGVGIGRIDTRAYPQIIGPAVTEGRNGSTEAGLSQSLTLWANAFRPTDDLEFCFDETG